MVAAGHGAWTLLLGRELSLGLDRHSAAAPGFPRGLPHLDLDDAAIGRVPAALLKILECASTSGTRETRNGSTFTNAELLDNETVLLRGRGRP